MNLFLWPKKGALKSSMANSQDTEKKPSIAGGVLILSLLLVILVIGLEVDSSPNRDGNVHLSGETACDAVVEAQIDRQERLLLCLENAILEPCGVVEAGDRAEIVNNTCVVKKQGMGGDFRLLKGLKLNINRAQENELALLAGIGPTLSKRIVEYRKEHGPFRNIYGLIKVKGIGDATVKALEEYIEVRNISDE
tara:strand:- start:190 stop:771 length:582 start_codon:yes stop_codon:yes gene_type:complete